MDLCRLIYENLLVNREEGTAEFNDFREDEHQMGLLFQDFVRTFCERETCYKVSAPKIDWFGAQASETDLRHLPRMQTDITLRSPGAHDHFGHQVLQGSAGYPVWGASGARAGHLYQIFSYVTNWGGEGGRGRARTRGVVGCMRRWTGGSTIGLC